MIYFRCWASGKYIYPLNFSLPSDSLLTKFIPTSGTATWGASGHFDFSFSPINLRVVFSKPGMSEYQFLFTQVGDAEDGPFRMIFVPENEANSFGYGTGFIRGAVYVVDWNWMGQF